MPFVYESSYLDRPFVAGRAWDLFLPEGSRRPVAVFLIHGGGWRAGRRENMHRRMEALNGAGFICASADYRLEGVLVPGQLADLREAYAAFRARLFALGHTGRVVVFGSSAGAHLALLLALARPGACGETLPADPELARLAGEPPVGAAVQSAPATFEPWDEMFPQIRASMESIVGFSFEARPELYRQVSPIAHVAPGCPPLFLMEAEYEYMFPRELNQRLVEAVRAAGGRAEMVVYPKAEHGFFYEFTRRCQKQALADLIAFLASCE